MRKVPKPQSTPAPKRVVRAGSCPPGASGTIVRDGMRVRCGPQSSPYVTEVRRGEAPGAGKNVYRNQGNGRGSWDDSRLDTGRSLPDVDGDTRIVPDQVWERRSAEVPTVPAGYRPAWEDDRLNRYRAVQTVQGYYDTQEVWTNDLPRRQVVASRHHQVRDPVLLYDGYPKLTVVRRSATSQLAAASGVQRRPYVSTRSAPVEAPRKTPAASSKRYVEIGAFTTDAKARAAVARLSGAGLTVRSAPMTRNGRRMQRIVVGPYADAGALRNALSRVRATGYTQAYLR
ncbi:Calphotin [Salipiger mucosus DSM 16094]|uniref:Calphotin n=1 Tax=Salipiger mucosus DSM 16094 TaxID=1123237 RepID=S9QI56_9RHOB|nr:Calphotin [Salipiger mucosus DSM 16094]